MDECDVSSVAESTECGPGHDGRWLHCDQFSPGVTAEAGVGRWRLSSSVKASAAKLTT